MKKNNYSSFVVLVLLIVAASFYFSWQFILPNYKQNRLELAKTNMEIDSAKEKLDSLKTAQSSLNSLGNMVDQMFVAVPKDADESNLITELEAIATKCQTYIPSIQIGTNSSSSSDSSANSFTDTASAGSSNVIPISFSVNGSYENLNQFVTDVEKDVRFMDIKTLSLSVSDGKASLSMQINSFKRPSTSLSASVPANSQSTTDTTSVSQ